MKETLRVINEMRDAGVIGDYAIGGCVGAIFYLEPMDTEDVDIFVALPSSPSGILGPIFEYLLPRGFQPDGQYFIIGDWPVQFIPPGNALVEEALAEAVEHEIEDLRTCVFTPEHLAAICLDVGRLNDLARLGKFIEDGALDLAKFDTIIRRHGLLAKWREFEQKYLPPPT